MAPVPDVHPWTPNLERCVNGTIAWWTDPAARERGIIVAFSERSGGVSAAPFGSLNLASHVGDDPRAVDENRGRLLEVLGIGQMRSRLTMAEQVHSDSVAVVGATSVGFGARAVSGPHPIEHTDALITAETDAPLALCFADCVPVVLVAPSHGVAVAHAGWRGALNGIVAKTVREITRTAGCSASQLVAYVGPHIGACHYEVSDEIMSQFCNTFGTFARAKSGGLDLDVAVTASLVDAGVNPCSIARLGTCTAEATDRFFSYRAEGGRTGRHCALACALSGDFSQPR